MVTTRGGAERAVHTRGSRRSPPILNRPRRTAASGTGQELDALLYRDLVMRRESSPQEQAQAVNCRWSRDSQPLSFAASRLARDV